MEKIKSWVLSKKIIRKVVFLIYKNCNEIRLRYVYGKKLLARNDNQSAIYYLGIPVHRNLGDLAQGVCIRKWLKKFYSDYQVIELETDALVNTHFSLLYKLKSQYRDGDIIVFQSGYTTTDLGGYADEMHRAVFDILPGARYLMMPQTIFFQKKENELRTAQSYNSVSNMLFLARDEISYNKALNMFPSIRVVLFPDIVTTLIGKYHFQHERKGILFCCRKDVEKYYSDEQIESLMSRCRLLESVDCTDTTKAIKKKTIVDNAQTYVEQEIECYSRYKIVITDRYHGTILSLAAGTPTIILQTSDHKVITGKKWFDGIYDDYVYLAESLADAYTKVQHILGQTFTYKLHPVFQEKYYDTLSAMFNEMAEEKK